MTMLTCMRGYPASGKDTMGRMIAELTGAVFISRDAIREMLFGCDYQYSAESETTVNISQRTQVDALLKNGRSVVIADTNLKARYLNHFRDMARRCGADFEVVDVPTDVETCIERNRKRGEAGGRFVPEDVIRDYAKRYPISRWPVIKPREPIFVNPLRPGENSTALPPAVIVDIDGTLANHEGIRSPYDYDKVSLDTLHEDVAYLVRILAKTNHIIICSGRDDTCRRDTLKWLVDNAIPFHNVLMRPTDEDERGKKDPDWMVKMRLFNEEIRGKYHVRMVLDDRTQVVELWRRLGLRCLQVAPGDF